MCLVIVINGCNAKRLNFYEKIFFVVKSFCTMSTPKNNTIHNSECLTFGYIREMIIEKFKMDIPKTIQCIIMKRLPTIYNGLHIFFSIKKSDSLTQDIIIKLDNNNEKTCKHFLSLINGEGGFGYKGLLLYKIIRYKWEGTIWYIGDLNMDKEKFKLKVKYGKDKCECKLINNFVNDSEKHKFIMNFKNNGSLVNVNTVNTHIISGCIVDDLDIVTKYDNMDIRQYGYHHYNMDGRRYHEGKHHKQLIIVDCGKCLYR